MWEKIYDNAFELVAGLCALIGWGCLTYGAFLIFDRLSVVYISVGLLLGSLAGWRVIFALVLDGIYATATIDNTEAEGSAQGNNGERRRGRRSTLPSASSE